MKIVKYIFLAILLASGIDSLAAGPNAPDSTPELNAIRDKINNQQELTESESEAWTDAQIPLLNKSESIYYIIAGGNYAPAEMRVARLKQLIAERKGDANEVWQGYTPLHAHLQYSATADFVKLLLEAGANPNKTDKDGNTPLMIIAGEFHTIPEERIEIIKELIGAGANLTARNKNDQTALDIARERFPELVDLLTPTQR